MSTKLLPAERERAYMDGWRGFFHAVATVQELDMPRLDEQGRQRPLPVELLGERLVIARLDGKLVAMSGTCPHRGTGLGIGWISGDGCQVVCRYHGAGWRGDGALGSFPAVEIDGHALPKWTVPVYQAEEKYGLIWVCLAPEPRFPLFDIPEYDNPDYLATSWREQVWQAGVGRMVEATLDTYHFAFTHVGTIGDPNNPRAPEARTEVVNRHLTFGYSIDQPANEGTAAAEGDITGTVEVSYRMTAIPNVVHLRKSSGAGNFVIVFAYAPLGPARTKFFRLVLRDHNKNVPNDVFMDMEDRINEQNQHVVETMRPWELSTDLESELQVYMDRPTVGYRKWLAEMGVEYL